MPNVRGDKHTEIVWARIDAVIQLILENDRYMQSKRGAELTKIVMEKYNVKERAAKNYIAEAKKEVRSIGRGKATKIKEKIVRRLEYQYNRVKNTDGRLALDIIKHLGDLYEGVVPYKKVKQENFNLEFDPNKFTTKGLERIANGEDIMKVMSDPESVINKSSDG